MIERRASERFEVELAAKVSSCASGPKGGCVLWNISKGGAFIRNAPELNLGERVQLQLDSGMVFVGNLVRGSELAKDNRGFAVRFVSRGVLIREGKPVLLQTG